MSIKDHMKFKTELKHWKVGAIGKQLWSERARHATVLIDAGDQGAHALIADESGVREAFKVPPGQIGEVIGAAAQAWFERGMQGSFAVFARGGEVELGILTPPPPPPPGPGGHERIFLKQAAAAHVVLDAAVGLARLGGFSDLKQLDSAVERLTEGLPAD